ncbi:MAG: hypothetical protein Q7R40_18305 [Phaeospirillum sp.]|nr:hypothetical protein [Phaeospirillum sp.]
MLSNAIQSAPTVTEPRYSARGGLLFHPRMLRPRSFFTGNAEPSLDELMNDPIMRGMMACDGVAPDSLRSLIDEVRIRLL